LRFLLTHIFIGMKKRLVSYNHSRSDEIPPEIRNSMAFVRKRFQFNIEQIEKRYCSTSSGLVFNLYNDKVDFIHLL
jgi:hypothetical protein